MKYMKQLQLNEIYESDKIQYINTMRLLQNKTRKAQVGWTGFCDS